MKRARERVLALLILACIAFGASIAASARYPSGWMILAAFGVGFVCAWMLFGALMAYGQQRTRAKLTAVIQRKQQAAKLAEFVQMARANAAAHAVPPAENTTEGTEQ